MKTAFVILGMHRSGTSSVAGALAHIGATAPRTLMAPKPENPRGFWESEAIMELNDEILGLCGSSWHDWRRLNPASLSGDAGLDIRRRTADMLEAEFGDAETIVLKDPRICRFYGFWKEALVNSGYEPLVISPIRSPAEVAASLAARNAASEVQGLRLWLRHVLDAESDSRGQRRHLMTWDDFLADWRGQFRLMSARLGRPFALTVAQETELESFLASDLRHQHPQDDRRSPVWVREAHEALRDLAHFGENETSCVRLDAIRAAFEPAADLFQDAPEHL